MRIKSSIIADVLEIESNGKIVASFPYRVNIAEAANRIVQYTEDMTSDTTDEERGTAFVRLLTVIFGSETTDKIVDFYKTDRIAMVADIMPILTDTIFPAIKEQREKINNATRRRKF